MELLVISSVWVEPQSSAAGWRMLRLIESFQGQGYHVHYASTALPSDRSIALSDGGCTAHHIKVNDDAFDAWITALAPDVVLFDRFMLEEQFGWRIAAYAPTAIRLLDTEDLHGLRYAREAAVKAGVPFSYDLLSRDIMHRELASIHRCDLSLIISPFEMDLLKAHFGVSEGLLHYLPFFVEETVPSTSGFSERLDFMTIGNFRHAPNYDAVHVLKDSIWPKIRAELPSANLHVYGAYMDRQAEQWNDPTAGFYLHGSVKEVAEPMRAHRLLLAPLRFGAGLKGKLVDAMRFGLPSVTTSIGAEGLGSAEHWPGAVSDDWEELIGKSLSLYREQNRWQQAADKCAIALKPFQDPQHEQALHASIKSLSQNLQVHRTRNWIGGMLSTNSQKRYTYLSKWIMAKNRPQD